MEISHQKANAIDVIRRTQGIDRIQKEVMLAGKRNKKLVATLLNDDSLSFCSLFALIPQIKDLNLYPLLNNQRIIALSLCGKIRGENTNISHIENQSELEPIILRWIFESGLADDGTSDNFDNILDLSASLLINTYQDYSILPLIAQTIFKRYRKNRYIHDLVWVFFQSKTVDTLYLLAKQLTSSEQKDVELASNLLNISSNTEKYDSYLEENLPFLYFTDECYSFESNPKMYQIDLGAKYLGRKIEASSRELIDSLSETEQNSLACFLEKDIDTCTLLSDYSRKIHHSNTQAWSEWINSPIDKQLEIAKNEMEGAI